MNSRESSTQVLDRLRQAFGADAFTLTQAESREFSHQQIQRLARLGLVHRLKRGTYVSVAEDLEVALAVQQARWVQGSGIPTVISGKASARIWGMVLPSEVSGGDTILIVPQQVKMRRGRRHGLVIRGSYTAPEDHIETDDGLHVATPIRTSLDIASLRQPAWSALWVLIVGKRRQVEWQLTNSVTRRCSDHQLAIQAQSELVRTRVMEQLDAALDRRRGWGDRRVRLLSPFADIRLESPLEARSWLSFSEGDLPMPQPQAWVQGASGRWYRADFGWGRVLGEADGAMKYTTPEDLHAEKQRQEDLERVGFIIVRWSWAEMAEDPAAVSARIRRALARVSAGSVA